MVEAWVEELNQWVLVDPTNDTMFVVDGQYASLLQLRRALLAGKLHTIRFERNGSNLKPSPDIQYFTQISKHAFVFADEHLFNDPPLTKASVWSLRVLHYVDEHAEAYPELAKKVSLVCGAVLGACSFLLLGASMILGAVVKPRCPEPSIRYPA
jgi:hypothetical protein